MSDYIGLYNTTEESPHWSVGSSASSDGQQVPGDKAQAEAVVLRKDPIMLLNEHCQRNHLKVQGIEWILVPLLAINNMIIFFSSYM